MTTHSWDEDPSGEWVLEIENTSEANNYGMWGTRELGGVDAGSQFLLTLASFPSWNRDADQIHPRAIWHSP